MALDDKKFIDFLKGLNELENTGKDSVLIKEMSIRYGLIAKNYLTNYNVSLTDSGLKISKKEKK